ncbi:MAG: putative bifunctional diguanylate cyclase/phosphodiesterase [Acidimicrobiia bacterium]
MTGSARTDRPLREQLAHLRVIERAATAANAAASLEEAATAVLEEVCRFAGWPAGHLYLTAPPGDVALPSTAWYLEDPDRFAAFCTLVEATPLAAGEGLAGRVLQAGRPEWVADAHLDPTWSPGAAVLDNRPRAAFGAPVLVGEEVAGVLVFVTAPPDDRSEVLADLVLAAAPSVGRAVERSRVSAALHHAEARYRALADGSGDAVVVLDARGLVRSCNAATERLFAHPPKDLVGRPLGVLLAGAEPSGLAECRSRAVAGVRADGLEFPAELTLRGWQTAEGEQAYVAVLRDVSERHEAEQARRAFEHQLAQRVLHDPLTSLPNRALLHDRLEHAVARSRRRGSHVAVISVDIDRFKSVNDSYGHQVGDQLLVAVAARLNGALRSDDTLARIGGDEFAVLCEEVGDADEALAHARRVAEALQGPFPVGGRDVPVGASVGVALSSPATTDPGQLLRDAEAAVGQGRQRGRVWPALYEESMRADASERLSVERDLRLAIRDGQLQLHYQPIVDLESFAIRGVEALVRWEHPTRGLVPPLDFIPLAEESGLIVPLGRWVLETACLQGAAWQRGAHRSEPVRVSVNVSARQFQHPGWTDDVAHALLLSGLDPACLVLEITESSLMEDTATTMARLAELRALGVSIAIDDFGTGYSSLGYLRQFPVDVLKVDKSFIDGVAEGPHDSALARAVIKLAATLGLDAVAEGVSSRKQMAALRRLRCRYAQGYYFSRPLPLEAVNALLARRVLVGEGLDEVDP